MLACLLAIISPFLFIRVRWLFLSSGRRRRSPPLSFARPVRRSSRSHIHSSFRLIAAAAAVVVVVHVGRARSRLYMCPSMPPSLSILPTTQSIHYRQNPSVQPFLPSAQREAEEEGRQPQQAQAKRAAAAVCAPASPPPPTTAPCPARKRHLPQTCNSYIKFRTHI